MTSLNRDQQALDALPHASWLIERYEHATASFSANAGILITGLLAEAAILSTHIPLTALLWLAPALIALSLTVIPHPGRVPDPQAVYDTIDGKHDTKHLQIDQILSPHHPEASLLNAANRDRSTRARLVTTGVALLATAQVPLALTMNGATT